MKKRLKTALILTIVILMAIPCFAQSDGGKKKKKPVKTEQTTSVNNKRKQEEARRQREVAARKQEEERLRQEAEVKRHEEERLRQEAEAKRHEEERLRHEEEAKRQEMEKSMQETGIINGHGYVDLGLPSGLKWATCNVGASSPSDYGNYYAWGEIYTKLLYTEDNCQTYGKKESKLRKSKTINSLGNLTMPHDAAQYSWGVSWRMPTLAEFKELIKCCKWEVSFMGKYGGYKVIGPNGNYIFLPAGGKREGSSLYRDGSQGVYWCSTPSDSADYAHELFFGEQYSGSGASYKLMLGSRCRGLSVRPVSE